MDNLTVSITFNGEINDNDWGQWYNDAKNIVKLVGYNTTHIGISGIKFKSEKVLDIRRYEKKIVDSINNGDAINYISLYSLPKNYESASFDYDVFLAREKGYVTLIMNKLDFKCEHEDVLIEILRKHINVNSGEIYEMDRDEVPLLYAAKDNVPETFKSLKILKIIK